MSRCGKSCRLRWTNYLRPDIKRGPFSSSEESTIISLQAMLGNRYANHSLFSSLISVDSLHNSSFVTQSYKMKKEVPKDHFGVLGGGVKVHFILSQKFCNDGKSSWNLGGIFPCAVNSLID